MSQTTVNRKLKLLVIVAHPHDFVHMAGTCAHHIERGDTVKLVAVTGGIHIHNENLQHELRKPVKERDMRIVNEADNAYGERKEHEMIQAARYFGITDVQVWSFPDNPLNSSVELVNELADVFCEYRPDLLLTHAPYVEANRGRYYAHISDHVAAGIAVQQALNRAGTPDRDTQRTPHRVTSIYYMAAEFDRAEIDVVIDITDQAHNRMKAEKAFKSQGHSEAFARKRMEHRPLYDGWAAGYAYGESFIRARLQVDRHLPVSEEEMRLAAMSSSEELEQISYIVPDE